MTDRLPSCWIRRHYKMNLLLTIYLCLVYIISCVWVTIQQAVLAQSVARRLGKAEVGGSSPLDSFDFKFFLSIYH